ncbi:uncharacterized protein LOC115623764 [Scaptodrosophila lebanonensis]|uniref:Uncharacterized protein LOC115623764 n=1 Tax=Drosophila lebanonensis TaxID=7225 RepID=A0A6J2TFF2_DROLE|nr:uncharacterized protein LOC115623764 [Scaptodrosophila lebanonensis]
MDKFQHRRYSIEVLPVEENKVHILGNWKETPMPVYQTTIPKIETIAADPQKFVSTGINPTYVGTKESKYHRPRYSDDFKSMAVQRMLSGEHVMAISMDTGASLSSLYRWKTAVVGSKKWSKFMKARNM